MKQKVSLSGKSESTLRNYTHHLAKMALHFECLPTTLDSDQIDDYLYLLQQQHNTPSDSYFKHTVYGLRFAFRMEGLKDKRIELPSIKKDKKLPIILSREEVRLLLNAPKLLKHRVLIGLLYGCGLRCFEVRSIRLEDLDFDRKMLHVKKGKNKKDRYVPLSDLLIRGLKTYIISESPQEWLFNGQPNGRAGGDFDSRYSQKGVQWAVNEARKDAGIIKPMTVHTLRHTYATHLLEDGLDIVSIKELLGHECIDTTLIYLHVAQSGRVKPFSPLDNLYHKKKMRPLYEVADVLKFHWPQIEKLSQINSWQLRTLGAVKRCRTAAVKRCRTAEMGGHVDACSKCNTIRVSYNSCRNRHCPKCQGKKREQWIQSREQELLPVPYFHVFFTLPSELNALAMHKPAMVYNTLFDTAWDTIRTFGYDPKHLGAKTGMICILHTWGQTLSLHPHLHCIVPGGGITANGKWKTARSKGKYLFPVKAMSKVFRAKFVQSIKKKYPTIDKHLINELFSKKWVVYAKRPFANTNSVIEYLGRYTHKIAISNHRIINVDSGAVTFSCKDYRKGAQKNEMTLHGIDFTKRFYCQKDL